MRVLVQPHDLGMGGSQLNAIELAAAVRDLGHDVVVAGRPDTLCGRIADLGLEFLEIPPPGRRPSRAVVGFLRDQVRRRGLDVLHGYEWPPILEARIAAIGTPAVAVGTVMSMAVAPFIPAAVPLVVGTRQIAGVELSRGRPLVEVIEPPVDLQHNRIGPDVDPEAFRRAHGIRPDDLIVVVVNRLAHELKLEGLLTAIRTVPTLPADPTLVVVGDGPARDEVEREAATANARAARRAVVLTGALEDPRAAYAAADVTLGMGGSALRAMAFGAPLVVQGEQGFWRALTPDSLDAFRWTGWYGIGSGSAGGADLLARELTPLLLDADLRRERGALASRIVTTDFSLKAAARRQVAHYERALAVAPTRAVALGDLVGAGRLGLHTGRRRIQRLRGTARSDDFNAAPVAARDDGVEPGRPLVLAACAVAWDAVQGTDHRLIEHLREWADVVWIDPALPMTDEMRSHNGQLSLPMAPVSELTEAEPGLWRLRTVTTPGVTRPGLRDLADRVWRHQVARLASEFADRDLLAYVSNPTVDPRWVPGRRRVVHITDDFVGGAQLMGLPADRVRSRLRDAVRSADAAFAVSPELAEQMERLAGRPVGVLSNGCNPEPLVVGEFSTRLPSPRAGLVGQLNARLDVPALEAVVDAGVPVLVAGPIATPDPDVRTRLEALLARPGVEWLGRRPVSEIPAILQAIDVGLTPYADSAFNRASSPLKTLEYLASGVPVVSSHLPAAVALAAEDPSGLAVTAAATPEEFAAAVVDVLQRPEASSAVAAACLALARRHSWAARADVVRAALADETPSRTPKPIRAPRPL